MGGDVECSLCNSSWVYSRQRNKPGMDWSGRISPFLYILTCFRKLDKGRIEELTGSVLEKRERTDDERQAIQQRANSSMRSSAWTAGRKPARCADRWESSEASFYFGRRMFSGMGVSELSRLRQLEEENNRLKKLGGRSVGGQHILQEVLAKKL